MGVFFWPLTSLDFFEAADTPVAHQMSRFGLNLPSPFGLSEVDVKRVCKTLEEYLISCATKEKAP